MMWQSGSTLLGSTGSVSFCSPSGAPVPLLRPKVSCWRSTDSVRNSAICITILRVTM